MRVINPCVNDVASQNNVFCNVVEPHTALAATIATLDRDGCEVLCSLQNLGHNASVVKKDSMQLTEVMYIGTCKNVFKILLQFVKNNITVQDHNVVCTLEYERTSVYMYIHKWV